MRLRGIDTNLVISLHALLTERNVTRAAKRVGLGQSSMSHALNRLRAHFGDALLVQVGRTMVLTEKGKTLVGPVELAMKGLEGVFEAERPFDAKKSERVFRIVGTDNLELYLLPRLASLVTAEAPAVQIRFHHLRRDWARALRDGEADLKLGRAYAVDADLSSEELASERLVCVVRGSHKATKRRLTLERYASLVHVAVTPAQDLTDSLATFVDTELARHQLTRRIALTVPHFLVAPFVAASSDLALTTSERLAKTFDRALDLAILELPFDIPAYALSQVWAKRADADPGHRWLRGTVARAFALAERG